MTGLALPTIHKSNQSTGIKGNHNHATTNLDSSRNNLSVHDLAANRNLGATLSNASLHKSNGSIHKSSAPASSNSPSNKPRTPNNCNIKSGRDQQSSMPSSRKTSGPDSAAAAGTSALDALELAAATLSGIPTNVATSAYNYVAATSTSSKNGGARTGSAGSKSKRPFKLDSVGLGTGQHNSGGGTGTASANTGLKTHLGGSSVIPPITSPSLASKPKITQNGHHFGGSKKQDDDDDDDTSGYIHVDGSTRRRASSFIAPTDFSIFGNLSPSGNGMNNNNNSNNNSNSNNSNAKTNLMQMHKSSDRINMLTTSSKASGIGVCSGQNVSINPSGVGGARPGTRQLENQIPKNMMLSTDLRPKNMKSTDVLSKQGFMASMQYGKSTDRISTTSNTNKADKSATPIASHTNSLKTGNNKHGPSPLSRQAVTPNNPTSTTSSSTSSSSNQASAKDPSSIQSQNAQAQPEESHLTEAERIARIQAIVMTPQKSEKAQRRWNRVIHGLIEMIQATRMFALVLNRGEAELEARSKGTNVEYAKTVRLFFFILCVASRILLSLGCAFRTFEQNAPTMSQ
jgi:hypothetical protein